MLEGADKSWSQQELQEHSQGTSHSSSALSISPGLQRMTMAPSPGRCQWVTEGCPCFTLLCWRRALGISLPFGF